MTNAADKIHPIGIAADHGGYELKEYLMKMLREAGYEIIDFGNKELAPADDYPDYVIPLAKAISNSTVSRGIAICGSGVGACIAANKVIGVRACLIHEKFSAQQGVEDDNMNMICLGGRVVDHEFALKLSTIFLASKFIDVERHTRRLAKITELENIEKNK
jgi:ribose 5-phosphate isomerase B